MITLIFILVLLAFLQSTILPFNLVFLWLLSRAFLVEEKANYYLAFFLGLLLSLLLNYPLGFLSLIYLLAVLTIRLIKAAQLSSSWLAILPLSALLLLLDLGAKSLILKNSLDFSSLIWQIILILPIFFLLKFWEERLIIKSEIKLKLGK